MLRFVALLSALAIVGMCSMAYSQDKAKNALDFKMKSIDGKDVNLSDYKGKVVMFVNVASKCGYTPLYKALQENYDKYKEKGFVIIGVPANEFGKQEPGTDEDIAKFCTSKYNVTFPMLSKVVVNGKGIAPLYDYLTSKDSNPRFGGAVKWNFTRFLVNRQGEIVNRFEPAGKMDAKEIAAIEAELDKK